MVKEWKIEKTKEIADFIKSGKYVGILNMKEFKSSAFQKIRKDLKDKIKIKYFKTSLIIKAIENFAPEYKDIIPYIEGKEVALFITEEEPFKLYQVVKNTKAKIGVKPGQSVDIDIVVPKGPTGVPPGRDMATFKMAGINVRPQGKELVVMEDTVVVKAGEAVKPEVISVLNLLGMKPLEVYLNVEGIYSKEEGVVFTKDILDVDLDKVFNDFVEAAKHAYNLSVEIAWPTKENIEAVLSKAHSQAVSLSVESAYPTKDTVDMILARANNIAKYINENYINE
jgi:large subunit ribosomal protein L10